MVFADALRRYDGKAVKNIEVNNRSGKVGFCSWDGKQLMSIDGKEPLNSVVYNLDSPIYMFQNGLGEDNHLGIWLDSGNL